MDHNFRGKLLEFLVICVVVKKCYQGGIVEPPKLILQVVTIENVKVGSPRTVLCSFLLLFSHHNEIKEENAICRSLLTFLC